MNEKSTKYSKRKSTKRTSSPESPIRRSLSSSSQKCYLNTSPIKKYKNQPENVRSNSGKTHYDDDDEDDEDLEDFFNKLKKNKALK